MRTVDVREPEAEEDEDDEMEEEEIDKVVIPSSPLTRKRGRTASSSSKRPQVQEGALSRSSYLATL